MTVKDGILVLNKPQAWTSSDCVAICRRALKCKGIKKVGHGGTLDPMATGVLPIFVGQATRIMEYLDLDSKTYRATAQLGKVTDTLDIWGEMLEIKDFSDVSEQDVLNGLKSFEGWILQTPPKYSAVRINGKRLYEYAYKGQEIDVDITKRTTNVSAIDLVSIDISKGEFVFDVTCSKGTYIRSICSDLGEKLGCGCVMTALERTQVGNIGLDADIPVISPLEIKGRLLQIEEETRCPADASRAIRGTAKERCEEETEAFARELEDILLDGDYPLVHFGKVEMPDDRVVYFSRGNAIWWNQLKVPETPDVDYMLTRTKGGDMPKNARGRDYDRIYRVYDSRGRFLGTGFYDKKEGKLKADKVFIEQIK